MRCIRGVLRERKAICARPHFRLASFSTSVHTRGVAVLLLDRGWSVSALPGETPTFTKDGRSISPFADLSSIARKKFSPEDWETMWRDIGLLNEDLGAAAKREVQARFAQLTSAERPSAKQAASKSGPA